jgi:hypothetical protein
MLLEELGPVDHFKVSGNPDLVIILIPLAPFHVYPRVTS